MRAKLTLGCLVNVHVHVSGGPQNPVKLGTQGSLKYYENRDPGPNLGGPHFHMTPGVLLRLKSQRNALATEVWSECALN